MKKFVRLFWQVLLFPVLYFPYRWLNQAVIVQWLGCGCPQIDENGQAVYRAFNANDFTWFFWWAVALAVMIISLCQLLRMKRWQYKVLYLIVIFLACALIVPAFFESLYWN